jgi:hypothetical protein
MWAAMGVVDSSPMQEGVARRQSSVRQPERWFLSGVLGNTENHDLIYVTRSCRREPRHITHHALKRSSAPVPAFANQLI